MNSIKSCDSPESSVPPPSPEASADNRSPGEGIASPESTVSAELEAWIAKLDLKKISGGLLSLLFPTQCAACKRYMKDFTYLYVCPECYRGIKKLEGVLCKTCMKPLDADYLTQCRECRLEKRAFTNVAAGGVYSGALKELIHLMKFYERKKTAKLLAEFVLENVLDSAIKWADVIVPVPLSKKVLAERGYNQTALVAKILTEKYGIEFGEAVKKVRETEPQNKLERKDRLRNLRGAFEAVFSVTGRKVLVVDDVYTTGATMNEMAKTLKRAGALEVRGVVVARSV